MYICGHAFHHHICHTACITSVGLSSPLNWDFFLKVVLFVSSLLPGSHDIGRSSRKFYRMSEGINE